jgi:hypothetical protein
MINETPKFPIAQASRTTAHGPSRLETIALSFFVGIVRTGLVICVRYNLVS